MALPQRIPVKISSEAAGYVSITPVTRQEIEVTELVERILVVTGKKPSRIRDILSRGSFVSGSARYRWEPIEAGDSDLGNLLDRFPDEQPDRPFDADKCSMVVFQGLRGEQELIPEAAAKRRLFKKRSFWDVVLPLLADSGLTYHRYSYAEHADVYRVALTPERLEDVLGHTNLLKYPTIGNQLRFLQPESAELFVKR